MFPELLPQELPGANRRRRRESDLAAALAFRLDWLVKLNFNHT